MTMIAALICRGVAREVETIDGARTAVIDDLCHRPAAAARAVGELGATRVVLGLCDGRPSTELTGALRRAGVMPFGVAAVALAGRRRDEATALLGASVARLAALASGERGKPRLVRDGVSRRALFSPGSIVTDGPVAVLDASACLGTAACGVCVGACPERAIEPARPAPSVNPDRCTACGACVPSCPAGALRLAGCSTGQIEAQLGQLLPGIGGIVFACESARATAPSGWALIELPTLGILTPGWILQAHAHGAEVELAPCENECCAGARELEQLAGQVLAAAGSSARPRGGRVRLDEPFATADAARRTTRADATLRIEHRRSPLGLLEFDAERCTVCGACAIACPTNALELDEGSQATALRHVPALCIGCDRCTSACPEDALDVARGIDLGRLREGPRDLIRAEHERCTVCGAQLPPRQLRRRLRELLPSLDGTPLELCTGCAATLGRPRSRTATGAAPGSPAAP